MSKQHTGARRSQWRALWGMEVKTPTTLHGAPSLCIACLHMLLCACVLTCVALLVRRMGIQAIYSGHDHNNDFFGSLNNNMRLAYGYEQGKQATAKRRMFSRALGATIHGEQQSASRQLRLLRRVHSCPTHRRKTGYGSYGPPQGWQHGARVILLRQGEPAHHSQTWLRMENGAHASQEASRKPWWSPFKQYVCAFGACAWGVLKRRVRKPTARMKTVVLDDSESMQMLSHPQRDACQGHRTLFNAEAICVRFVYH